MPILDKMFVVLWRRGEVQERLMPVADEYFEHSPETAKDAARDVLIKVRDGGVLKPIQVLAVTKEELGSICHRQNKQYITYKSVEFILL